MQLKWGQRTWQEEENISSVRNCLEVTKLNFLFCCHFICFVLLSFRPSFFYQMFEGTQVWKVTICADDFKSAVTHSETKGRYRAARATKTQKKCTQNPNKTDEYANLTTPSSPAGKPKSRFLGLCPFPGLPSILHWPCNNSTIVGSQTIIWCPEVP